MKKITIYTIPTCPYCMRAKSLFDSLGINFEEVDVSINQAKRQEIIERYNWLTVPAIFIGDELVGGFDDVSAMHSLGELLEKLQD